MCTYVSNLYGTYILISMDGKIIDFLILEKSVIIIMIFMIFIDVL